MAVQVQSWLVADPTLAGVYIYLFIKNKESGSLSVKPSAAVRRDVAIRCKTLAACGPLVRVRVCAVEPMCACSHCL